MPTEKEMFERLLREELLPLFPQSDLSPAEPKHSHKRASYSASHARTAIRLQLSISSDHAFLIHRSQGFDEMEKMIMSAFVEQAAEILPQLDKSYAGALQKKLMDLVVAEAVSQAVDRSETRAVIAKLFDVFEQWAQETYEGHRIAAAFGIAEIPTGQHVDMPFENYFGLNLAKVVGDGCSSLVTLSVEGRPTGHHYLGLPPPNDTTFSPFAFIPMATWATGNKIAIALNRGGEILVFSQGQISFARRRGGWVHFTLTLHKIRRFLPSASAILRVWTNFPRA